MPLLSQRRKESQTTPGRCSTRPGPRLPQSSLWIWSDQPTADGPFAFRCNITVPSGTTVKSAEVLIIADNEYSLWLNGCFIGSGDDYTRAQNFTIDHIPGPSDHVLVAVYAAGGNTSVPTSGVAAALQVISVDRQGRKYVTPAVTDGGWKYAPDHLDTLDGFEYPNYSDSTNFWKGATVEYPWGQGPWNTPSVEPIASRRGTRSRGSPGTSCPVDFECPAIDNSAVSLNDAHWIWTTESDRPASFRTFRYNVELPDDSTFAYAEILMTCDDAYSLFVNGRYIGTGDSSIHAQRYNVTADDVPDNDDSILLAVYANGGDAAGLISAARITSIDDCGCLRQTNVNTDSNWKWSNNTSRRSVLIGTNDSKRHGWSKVADEGGLNLAQNGIWNAPAADTTLTPVGSTQRLQGAPRGA
ncbi:hypothetical protein D9758_003954 [Tetrapyrgos nigripes]|uniref:Uncharacterized protein n=1 Tax=Tetrapyrgos nigripes TaxID=182062 RepID=A0A8H5LRR9_9AGAR|nr:hypothetical protein D9758_003954 [Tetrapyrgos nigripes]